jgi:hypothetical protein
MYESGEGQGDDTLISSLFVGTVDDKSTQAGWGSSLVTVHS